MPRDSSSDTPSIPLDVTVVEQTPAGVVSRAERRDVVHDVVLHITSGSAVLASMACLDRDCDTLALGFLFTEGLIDSLADVTRMVFHRELYTVEVELARPPDMGVLQGLRSMTSGCGRGMTYVDPGATETLARVAVDLRVGLEDLLGSVRELNRCAALHRDVGGSHAVWLRHPQLDVGPSAGRPLDVLAEDVGRHNCVDRIAGELLRTGAMHRAGEGYLVTSGRISSDIVIKCVRMGVQLVVSRSAPTSSGIALARDYGLTLVGYARGAQAVLYTYPERVITEEES